MTEPDGRPSETASNVKSFGKGAALLSVGVAASGFGTYLFFALASHVLTKSEYGSVTLLWAFVFIVVSILYRPVEQLLSRSIAEREALGRMDLGPLRVAGLIQLGLCALFAAVALALRAKIQNDLFSGSAVLYWVMVAAILAYAASYYTRGYLAGRRRFGLYGILMATESISRLMFAVAVLLGIAQGRDAVAIGIAVAPLLSLAVVPWALAAHARRTAGAEADDDRGERKPERFTMSHGGWFAGAVLLIMASEQTFLNAGPLAVKAASGPSGTVLAGFTFNLLLVARAPLVLFQAVSTTLLPHLTKIQVTSDAREFRHSVRITLLAVAVFAALTIAVMAAVGPQLMQLLFSNKFTYPRSDLIVVSMGMGLYLAATTLNQAALAQGQARRAAGAWVIVAAIFLAWLFVPALTKVDQVVIGFAAAAAILCVLLYLLVTTGIGEHPEDIPTAGSVEEIEARLAAADEAGS